MIELEKNQFHFLKPLFPDEHLYVEVPMIVNDKRGRGWLDDLAEPSLGVITMGEVAYIEGDGDLDGLDDVIRSLDESVCEICCDKRFYKVLRKVFPQAIKTSNLFYEHDGVIRKFKVSNEFMITEVDKNLFNHLHETGETWLGSMFHDSSDFMRNGFGFAALKNGTVVSAATTFSNDKKRVNIGVGTHPDFRNLGLSSVCVSRLIELSIQKRLKPIWITGPDNIPSQSVATKNGFTKILEVTCYWIDQNVQD